MKEAKEKNREFLSRETFLSRKGDVMSVVKFEEFRILFPDPGWLNFTYCKIQESSEERTKSVGFNRYEGMFIHSLSSNHNTWHSMVS